MITSARGTTAVYDASGDMDGIDCRMHTVKKYKLDILVN